ncbi:unnamed protein product [Oikopleura dioica]|uniref:Uncharacterized protein n=1 Tax=Oikopleura dioica TaxID=34765 RepID=E4XE16_OIKDI|nr:unnamed protein product [Oikopleura dioica]CBY39610.1 unnamed protein product [Oikopleura dioica]
MANFNKRSSLIKEQAATFPDNEKCSCSRRSSLLLFLIVWLKPRFRTANG